MSENTPFGFGRFVPGFDFLQTLSKGASASLPGLSGWVTPTMNVAELDKRIQELKTVQFWLEQNARALSATVQALEVQKMTLSTLQGMNVAMGDMADAFTGKRAAQPDKAAATPSSTKADAQDNAGPADTTSPAGSAIDPMQWWNALTHQFQQIAAGAMQEAGAHQAAFEATRTMADGVMKSAGDMASQMVAAAQPATTPPKRKVSGTASGKKPAARKTPARGQRS